MNQKFKGLNNLDLDQPNQVEYNRRKNVQQDQRLASLEANVNQLITQVPAGYLPRVFYGLQIGGFTYRFDNGYTFNVSGLTGTIGDAYGLLSTAETTEYINAIAIQQTETQLKIVIKGDYNVNVSDFNLVNQRTGEIQQITLSNVLSYQAPSYLGSYDATENKGKQITVLNDIEFNDVNVTFAAVDYSGDGVYNWVRIGNFINGSDGRSIYALTQNTASAVFQVVKINDLVLAGEALSYGGTSFEIGDLKLIASLDPLVFENKGNIRGAQGLTGATGAPGATGPSGLTPEIIDGYWYIGDVNTGVKAEGIDGTDGTDGQSFAIQSSLYSAPSNVGLAGNTTPQGQALLTLPALPATGITGKGYIVYDPLTTPLSPYYDLYWANDGDSDWTIVHPFSGANGKNGTNGYTPYIQNNNWYINGQNTGVPATGPQGPKGDKGINFMGEWVAQNEYYVDDVVTYEGSSYICILNHSGATANPSEDTTDWTIFTQGSSVDFDALKGELKTALGIENQLLYVKNEVTCETLSDLNNYIANINFTSPFIDTSFNVTPTRGDYTLIKITYTPTGETFISLNKLVTKTIAFGFWALKSLFYWSIPDVSNKLDKLPADNPFSVYAHNPNNTSDEPYGIQIFGDTVRANTIPIRNSNGCLAASDPIQSYHLATKSYVDNKGTSIYLHYIRWQFKSSYRKGAIMFNMYLPKNTAFTDVTEFRTYLQTNSPYIPIMAQGIIYELSDGAITGNKPIIAASVNPNSDNSLLVSTYNETYGIASSETNIIGELTSGSFTSSCVKMV